MTLYTQWMTMLMMLLSGFLLGSLLDIYHVCKEQIRLRGWLLSLVDLTYWFISACLVFSLLWWSNWGELRFYILVAICAGVFIYMRWLSPTMVGVFRYIITFFGNTVRMLFRFVYQVIWGPIVYLIRLIWSVICWMVRMPVSTIRKWGSSFVKKNREKK